MWSGFQALPAYFGGKRKLCPRIFKEIARVYPPATWSRLRFVDPFLGGGSVSLYAKAHGFGVTCGDLAERSVVIGRALIENDSTRLTEPDLLRLLSDRPSQWRFFQDACAPEGSAARGRFMELVLKSLEMRIEVMDSLGIKLRRRPRQ